MEITFRTRKLRDLCSSDAAMNKELGKSMARKLKQRLAELQAVDTLADLSYLPPTRRHLLTEGKDKGKYSVDLEFPYRLLFVPAGEQLIHQPSGGLDQSQITAIEILEFKNTHKGGA